MLNSMKYNPGLEGDDELIKSFVVRYEELESILEVLRENRGNSNRHLLYVAPRGMGKSTLVRRVAAEVRRNPEYSKDWYPLVFAEEAYEVGTPGEFWLEALFVLWMQTQDERWRVTYEDLRKEHLANDARLRDRALAQLLDFANEQGKRILLVVENLNMLLGEQMSEHGDWDLRHTLLNEPRIMLLATATSQFEEIKNIEKAWFELFSIYPLPPLDEAESAQLWNAYTDEGLSPRQLRPIQILTGGNPRLLRILAEFAAKTSFRELMGNLVRLIDDHTEYFKSQLDHLPAVERKAFVALLDIWEPATARQVAEAARLDVNKTSSLLTRLTQRGAVMLVGDNNRKKYYQVAERLYNIYYLMRRRTHPSNRVKFFVRFVTAFFREDKLIHIASGIASEACQLDSLERQDHYLVYHEVIKSVQDAEVRSKIIRATPKTFFENEDIPEELLTIVQPFNGSPEQKTISLDELLNQPGLLENLLSDSGELEKQFSDVKEQVRLFLTVGNHLYSKGRLKKALEIYEKVENILRQSISKGRDELANGLAAALINGGVVLADLGRLNEAIASFDEAIVIRKRLVEEEHRQELANNLAMALMNRGNALRLQGRLNEAISSYDEVIAIRKRLVEVEQRQEFANDLAMALMNRGVALSDLGRLNEAIASFDEAIVIRKRLVEEEHRQELANNLAGTLVNLGNALSDLGRLNEAMDSFDEAIAIYERLVEEEQRDELANALAKALMNRGNALSNFGRLNEAITSYDEAITKYKKLLEEGRDELANDLARALINRGLLAEEAGDATFASLCCQEVEHLCEGQINQNAFTESFETFALLVQAFIGQKKWQEAIEAAKKLLFFAKSHESAIKRINNQMMKLAAAGYAAEVLKIVEESEGREALEPLEVGLKIFLGETPIAPQEIYEVGKDVAAAIRNLQKTSSAAKPKKATSPKRNRKQTRKT